MFISQTFFQSLNFIIEFSIEALLIKVIFDDNFLELVENPFG